MRDTKSGIDKPAMKRLIWALLALLWMPATPVMARVADCPLANVRYSSRTLLADLLADPRARTVLERDAPGVMAPITGKAGFQLPPPFMKIMTPAFLLRMSPADKDRVGALLDRDLGAIPLTPAVIAARCADYDQTPPALPATLGRPSILIFGKSTGFRDGPSVDAASAELKSIADKRHWAIFATDNAAVFNSGDLSRFAAVVWNNVSGDVLTLPQRAAFRRWMEQGGGFVGIHGSGGDPVTIWDWYADDLIGARFSGHPAVKQFQEAHVIVDDPGSAITAGLGNGWTMTEEWYSFSNDPRTSGAHVLLRLDENTYQPVGFGGEDIRMGDHPIAWTRCVGDGRSFYTAIGHMPANYQEPHVTSLLERGLDWATGSGASRCRAGKEIPAAVVPRDKGGTN